MQADLGALEFDAIRRALERLTVTPFGADAARALEPAPDLAVALQMQRSVSAARLLLEAGRAPALGQLPDVRAALRQAASPGAALSTQALQNLRSVMEAAAGLAASLEDSPELYPGDPAQLQPPPALAERLERCLVASGALREDASPALREAFDERRRLREEVQAVVRARMARADIRGLFEDPEKISWNSERAVIVLKAAEADKVKGVRRGTAMGGRDVIVEPMESVPLNNRLEQVTGRINAEQHRLLREITAAVGEHVERLQQMVSAITWIDLALAAGRLSQQMGAHAPRLTSEPVVELRRAYHPLLLLQFTDGTLPRPVPLSLRLDGERLILVVTGPNTGGKTVALKTVGLLTVMAHCGLHIPAEEDCLVGHYRRVIVDVGDHQSLFHHLSTFAGHVEVLKRVLAEADAHTLVLLDELGTGTDPEEGAALAMAVLDELVGRRVQGIVNTHLPPLKDYAWAKPGVSNASMQFDTERLTPTYELRIGRPGVSLGLTIAEKNGLPEALIGRARAHLSALSARGD